MKENLLSLVNSNLIEAETALQRATAETLVDLCWDYLQQLTKYRSDLYQLRGTPEISLHQTSRLAKELVIQTRKAIRTSIETTVKEINTTEYLLKSLTAINGSEAAATFNRLGYHGFDNWELKAGGINSPDNLDNAHFSIPEAVEIAGNLRCAAYAIDKTVF